ncbi:MAG: hypothetical protein NC920_04495, partial [Candidatus Omnitrophica bacterium]|nr:hypothetical protein [Candidatus Omnitrophota bacterium]
MKKNLFFLFFLKLWLCLGFIFFVSGFFNLEAAELVFDDFNDLVRGPNDGGNAGGMSAGGRYDPTIGLTSVNKYEGSYALGIIYNFPAGAWAGFWDKWNIPHNVSAYTHIRIWAKGKDGGEKFKVELADVYFNWQDPSSYSHLKGVEITTLPGFETGLSTTYQEIIIPLSLFAGVDLTHLMQVNIVIDQAPTSGTIYIDYIRFTDTPLPSPTPSPSPTPPGLPIYDDFNDGRLGPNLGGVAGFMGSVGHSDSYQFNSANAYEGSYALKFTLGIPSGGWAGYFDQWTTARDVSSYTDIRMWLKGYNGGEKFKVELSDSDFDRSDPSTYSHLHGVNITVVPNFANGLTTAYQELVIPLSTFTGVDMRKLKQINLVFDKAGSHTIYLDKIYFTNLSPSPLPLPGLILDNFNDGSGPNELGGDTGTMDPSPGNSEEWVNESYVNDSGCTHEGLGVLKLEYARGMNSWVGYWSFMKKDRTGYDVSSYTDIRINVRGNAGGEKFKVELVDILGGVQKVDITMATGFSSGLPSSEYREAVLPLSLFTGVNLSVLKQVNIIFDQEPR